MQGNPPLYDFGAEVLGRGAAGSTRGLRVVLAVAAVARDDRPRRRSPFGRRPGRAGDTTGAVAVVRRARRAPHPIVARPGRRLVGGCVDALRRPSARRAEDVDIDVRTAARRRGGGRDDVRRALLPARPPHRRHRDARFRYAARRHMDGSAERSRHAPARDPDARARYREPRADVLGISSPACGRRPRRARRQQLPTRRSRSRCRGPGRTPPLRP